MVLLDGTIGTVETIRSLVRRRETLRVQALYALDPDVTRNIGVFDTVRSLIPAAASAVFRSRAVLRIDDPWQAEHWRRTHLTAESGWLVDAIGLYEVTARILVDRWISRRVDRVALHGHSLLTLAVCNEYAQRRREFSMTIGAEPGDFELRIVIAGDSADAVREQYVLAQRRYGNLHEDVPVDTRPLTTELLVTLLSGARQPTVVFLGGEQTIGRLSVSALAVAYPEWSVLVFTADAGAIAQRPVMERLYPFGLTWASPADWGLDRWERVARIAHLNYLRGNDSDPASPSGQEWDDGLSDFYKQTNIRLITTTLSSAVAVGRTWGTFDPASGSEDGVAPTQEQLERMARLEHASWMHHYVSAGWSYAPVTDRERRRHAVLLEWDQLDDENRQKARTSVLSALNLLRGIGYRSSDARVPHGTWQTFQRKGRVHAYRTEAELDWTTSMGSTLRAEPGDWIVEDGAGRVWSVKPAEFAASYQATPDGMWERFGTVRAYRTDIVRTVETLEGPSRAEPGDWIVRALSGEYWPVPDQVFPHAYELSTDPVMTEPSEPPPGPDTESEPAGPTH